MYLELAVELGLPGLILFLLLLSCCLRKVRRIRRAPETGPAASESRLAEGIEIALMGFILAGFSTPSPTVSTSITWPG